MGDADLERENARALDLIQALLGNVFDGLLAASVQVGERSVLVHLRLDREPTADDQDDIDEIVVDFEALVGPECIIGGSEEVDLRLHVGEAPPGERALPGRLVFLRKSP